MGDRYSESLIAWQPGTRNLATTDGNSIILVRNSEKTLYILKAEALVYCSCMGGFRKFLAYNTRASLEFELDVQGTKQKWSSGCTIFKTKKTPFLRQYSDEAITALAWRPRQQYLAAASRDGDCNHMGRLHATK